MGHPKRKWQRKFKVMVVTVFICSFIVILCIMITEVEPEQRGDTVILGSWAPRPSLPVWWGPLVTRGWMRGQGGRLFHTISSLLDGPAHWNFWSWHLDSVLQPCRARIWVVFGSPAWNTSLCVPLRQSLGLPLACYLCVSFVRNCVVICARCWRWR